MELAKLSRSLAAGVATTRILGEAARSGALEAFAASDTAAVLVNRHGKIFAANASAERLLSGEIRLRKGKLIHGHEASFPSLDRALSRVLNHAKAGLHAPVALPRKDRGPLLAYPARLPGTVRNATGEALDKVADRLNISKETSRTQLKSIFAKLGVHRQAELVAVLSTLLSDMV
jgi:hypothetical protein